MQLSAEAADLGLSVQSQQSAETFLNGLAFGLQAGGAECVAYELVVDHDIRSHDAQLWT